MDDTTNGNASCLRGLKRFELGEDFNAWILNFYNEMVEKKLHQYFPCDYEYIALSIRIQQREACLSTATDEQKQIAYEKESDDRILSRSYLVRGLYSNTTRSLSAVKFDNEVGSLSKAFLSQCRSRNTHTLRELYHQIINIKMSTRESLISYQGRIQELILRLYGNDYAVPDAYRWGILTTGLLDVYKFVVRTLHVSLDELPYVRLVMKLQELSRGDIGDPNTPLEKQWKGRNSGSALNTTEATKVNQVKKFKGKCYWCLKFGQMV